MSDNIPFENNENEKPDDVFDLNNMQDAGESEESRKAEAEARQTVINMQHRADERSSVYAEAYIETDLVKRAHMLAAMQAYDFVHYKTLKDDFIQVARADSEMNRYAVFDALFDRGSGRVPYPHWDTFRGKFVDHHGETFATEKTLDTRELVEAVNAAGLDNPSPRQVALSYIEWAKQHKYDGLLDVFNKKMPEWDGKERLPTSLIELFKPFETKINRKISQYFWLSLYNRITNPGALAPISIALIGGQNVGKSYFSERLCKVIMDDPAATSIPLDFAARNYNDFLRDITGQSIIANVGEMTGFKKADIEAMKAFAARTGDQLNFKFMDTIIKPRQWVVIMDGNDYAGLQRDDTGNRRFYPLFVSQLPDKGGQPNWEKEGFKVNFDGFDEMVWQIMAECKEWMQEHKYDGYVKFVDEVSNLVRDFNKKEMDMGRGIIRDDTVDTYLLDFLLKAEYEKKKNYGWVVLTKTIKSMYTEAKLKVPHDKSLKTLMTSLGYEQSGIGGFKGYMLPFVKDNENGEDLTYLKTMLFMRCKVTDDDDMTFMEARARVIKAVSQTKDDDGF